MIKWILATLLLLTTACHPADVVLGPFSSLSWLGSGGDKVASWGSNRPEGAYQLKTAAWYKLDDSSLDTYVADSSTNAVNANSSMSTEALAVAGKVGGAFNFAGAYHAVGQTTYPDNKISVAFWAYLPSAAEKGAFFTTGSDYDGFSFGVSESGSESPGNEIYFLNNFVVWVHTGVSIGTGWHHMALVMSPSRHPTIFLDGQSVYSYSGSTPKDSQGPIQVGGGMPQGTYNRFFSGYLDDFRVYTKELQEAEIVELYNNGSGISTELTQYRVDPPPPPSPVITFDLGGRSGTPPTSMTVEAGAYYDYGTFPYASTSDPGYEFNGWRTADWGNWYYPWGSGNYPSADTTLYADWYYNPPTISVTFDLNGREASIDFSQQYYQATYPFDWSYGFPTATASDPNYVFSCWKDAGGNVWESYYNAPDSDLTLYVEWTYIGP